MKLNGIINTPTSDMHRRFFTEEDICKLSADLAKYIPRFLFEEAFGEDDSKHMITSLPSGARIIMPKNPRTLDRLYDALLEFGLIYGMARKEHHIEIDAAEARECLDYAHKLEKYIGTKLEAALHNTTYYTCFSQMVESGFDVVEDKIDPIIQWRPLETDITLFFPPMDDQLIGYASIPAIDNFTRATRSLRDDVCVREHIIEKTAVIIRMDSEKLLTRLGINPNAVQFINVAKGIERSAD